MGEWLCLPCKVGDTVYRITSQNVDVDGYRMQYSPQKVIVKCIFLHWMIDFWNKTVFLTKEQAETALKEMEDNNG